MDKVLSLWINLLTKGFDLSFEFDKILRPIRTDDIVKKVMNAFLFKANRSLCSVILLYKNNLNEEGQVFTRIMFELMIDFEYLILALNSDSKKTVERMLDSIVLEKMKQIRASNFAGIPQNIIEEYTKYESDAIGRYTMDDLKRLRQNGFSLVSIEDRAKKTGHSEEYNIVYRNFSRNVHNNDLIESFLQICAYQANDYELMKYSRDLLSMETSFNTICSLMDIINKIYSLGFKNKIDDLIVERKKIKMGET